MRVLFEAEVALLGKARAVVAGYRPTLQASGIKMLCNFDSVEPTPLKPTDAGRVKLRVLWDVPDLKHPLGPGVRFELFEGDRCVGTGVIVRLIDA